MTYCNRRRLAGEDPDDRHAHGVTLIHGGHIGSQGEGGGRFSSHCDRCLGCGHFRLGETVVSHADRTLWMNETNFILVDWNIMREGERQRGKGREDGGTETERDYATYRGRQDRSRGREGARERQIMQLTEEAKTETQRQTEKEII